MAKTQATPTVIKMACLSKMGPFPTSYKGKAIEVKASLDDLKLTGQWRRSKQTTPPPASLIEITGPGAKQYAEDLAKPPVQAVPYAG